MNPRCPDRLPGGSSSGAGSAVAGGLCDVGLGSDCAGSTRIPASYCGIYGMRPTHGRIPVDGVCPFAPSFDTVGWMARQAGVLARTGNILLAGTADAGRPGSVTTIIVAHDAFQLAGLSVERSLAASVAKLCDAVGQSREITVSDEGLERWAECFTTIQAFEIWRSLGDWVQRARPELGPGIRERIAHAATVLEEDAERQRAFRASVVERLGERVPPGTALCLPTAPGAAPLRHSPSNDVEVAFRARAISLLCIAGLGGLPQLTLPLGTLDGCPLGLSILGARGTDSALLALAASLDRMVAPSERDLSSRGERVLRNREQHPASGPKCVPGNSDRLESASRREHSVESGACHGGQNWQLWPGSLLADPASATAPDSF